MAASIPVAGDSEFTPLLASTKCGAPERRTKRDETWLASWLPQSLIGCVLCICLTFLILFGPLRAVVALCSWHLPELSRRIVGSTLGIQSTFAAPFCSLQRSRNVGVADAHEPYVRTEHVSCFDWTRPGCTSGNFTISLVGSESLGSKASGTEFDSPLWGEEMAEILNAVRGSPHYVEDPAKACVLVPALPHSHSGSEYIHGDHALLASYRLHQLPEWQAGGGRNFLLFDYRDSPEPEFDTGYAMVAKAGWHSRFFRPSFDVSLPLPPSRSFKDLDKGWDQWAQDPVRKPRYFATFQGALSAPVREALTELHDPMQGIVVVDRSECKYFKHDYIELLRETQFAFCPRGNGLMSYRLAEAVLAGAIPVIIGDGAILPFDDLLDWRSVAVVLSESQVPNAIEILRSLSQQEVLTMRCRLYSLARPLLTSLGVGVSAALETLRLHIRGVSGGRSRLGALDAFAHAGNGTEECTELRARR